MWRSHLSKVGSPFHSFYLFRSSSRMYCSSSDFFPSLFKHPVFKYVELEWVVSVRCRFSTNIASLMIVVFVKHFLMHLWMCMNTINCYLLLIPSFTNNPISHSFPNYSLNHSFIHFLNKHSFIQSFIPFLIIHLFIHFLNKHSFILSFFHSLTNTHPFIH